MTFKQMAFEPYVKSVTQNTDAVVLHKGQIQLEAKNNARMNIWQEVSLLNRGRYIALRHHNGMVFRTASYGT